MPSHVAVAVRSGILLLSCAFAVLPLLPSRAQAVVVSPGDILFCNVTGTRGLAAYSPASGTTSTISSGGLIPRPAGVAVESQATVLVTNVETAGRVVRVNLGDGTQTLVSEAGLLGSNPDGITMGLNSLVYVATLGNAIVEIDPATGQQRAVSAGGSLISPIFLTAVSPTTLIVTSQGPRVIEVDIVTGGQRLITSGGLLGYPAGVALLPDGALLVADYQTSRLVRVDRISGAQTQVASGIPHAWGVSLDGLGAAYVSIYAAGDPPLVRVDLASGTKTSIPISGSHAFGVQVYFPVTGPPPPPPPAPDGFLASDTSPLGVTLTWNPAAGADAYRIFRDDEPITMVSAAQTSHVDLPPAGTYEYCVSAVNLGGESERACDQGTRPAPETPAGFTASDSSPAGVTLIWNRVADAQSYRVVRDGATIASVTAPDTSHFDVPSVGAHQYCVRTVMPGAESEPACDAGYRRAYLAEPRIQFVRDVPADQGGLLAIGWLASEFDTPVTHAITSYRIWRRLPFTTEPAALAETAGLDAASGIRARANSVGTIEYWEPILTLPAGFREGYGAVAATTRDSLPDSNPFTAYFVSALTADPFVFYDSPVDSGYSVDNLAPPPPPQLAGAYGAAGAVRLSWRTAYAPDLGTYEVWRGQSRDLDLVHDEFLAATTDTAFTDENGGVFFYKVLARDVHGNRSAPSVLSPLDIPTPAWVLDTGEEWRDGALTIVVQLVRDFGWSAATVMRAETPDIEHAVIVASGLAPVEPGRFEYHETDVPAAGALWYWMRISDGGQRLALAGPVIVEPTVALARTAVFQAAPNPSRGAMSLGFVVGREVGGDAGAPVHARIFDAAGRRVRDLDLGALPPGVHDVRWDRRDDRGSTVGAGVYRLALTIGGQTFRRSVVLLP